MITTRPRQDAQSEHPGGAPGSHCSGCAGTHAPGSSVHRMCSMHDSGGVSYEDGAARLMQQIGEQRFLCVDAIQSAALPLARKQACVQCCAGIRATHVIARVDRFPVGGQRRWRNPHDLRDLGAPQPQHIPQD